MFFVGYLHGCNKIHDWHPMQPPACRLCRSEAAALERHPQVRKDFCRMVLLDMFAAAGQYSSDHIYFDTFERKWQAHAPQQVLYAVAASKYPSPLAETKRWCWRVHPALAHSLWIPGTWWRLYCCCRALDELD